MERIETEATINSLTHLESYYQSKYEHYLALATEAKEHRERVGLLLQDLCRDVPFGEDNSNAFRLSDRQQKLGGASHRSLDPERVIQELPQAEPSEPASSVVDEKRSAPSSVEQMKRWTLDLSKAMSVIELVSNSDSDSGKTLHQNYLHHLLNAEFEQELSVELVELYLEEATRRGYLEVDEFDRNCYRGKPKNDSNSEAFLEQNGQLTGRSEATTPCPHENIATLPVTTDRFSGRESGKPYDLPFSNRLKPTLFETIEGYIEENRPKRFSIDDVINYLYPQPVQLDWDKALKNKVRASISNVLGRKAYLGKYWSRIKPGVYRPRV